MWFLQARCTCSCNNCIVSSDKESSTERVRIYRKSQDSEILSRNTATTERDRSAIVRCDCFSMHIAYHVIVRIKDPDAACA